MKKVFKRLYELFSKLIESIISICSVVFFSSFRTSGYFKKERRKKNVEDACYILCNGPSLQTLLDGNNIPSRNLFVVNFFANTEVFFKIKPDNYFVLDNILVGRATKERMDRARDIVNLLYDNFSKVSWPMTLFYPSDGNQDVLKKILKNKNISVCIYNKTPVSGLRCISHYLYRKNLGMPRPQNISNAAIFCAINAGYKKIYLYGVEHSWQKSFEVNPENHRIFANDGHFYKKENIRYYKKGDYCRLLLLHHYAFKSHFMLREYADSLNTKIVNKTANSFIEAYEFEEY